MDANYLARHRAHDYQHLIARWRAVAKKTGLVMRRYWKGADFSTYYLATKRLQREGVLYLSAGIHGDEPGATEGLIAWAEKNTRMLRSRPFLIVPCINPWGLVNNSRTDAMRRDLNRCFQNDDVPEIAALKKVIGGRRFALAMTLHEDYDAQGIYIYEIKDQVPYWGEAFLSAASPHLPTDPRAMIEGREATGGLVRPVLDVSIFQTMGLPEAVSLKLAGCPRVFTIETPSEYSLERRVRAQVAVVTESLRLLGRTPARTK
jgi:protein MpaA